ncbi:MAG: sigma 54-interacting transcriptional regulator, partial [Verrucomicrobiota bacterium]|nr:sigma 54-interacting transcriptional regulator [Verrucomicrobiota bacterium]
TLFLDEIGEIDEMTQVKLLRFLGERTYERVGGSKTLSADVRVVAATNKNLKELVANGEFREDFYFRLGVVELWAPPLRERASDIPMLALSFLREFAEENAKPVTDFTADALEAVIRYAWPGNVRELRTAVEHAVVLARGEMIELAGLPQSVRSRGVIQDEKQLARPHVDKSVTLEEAEKQLIIRTLKECRGNRTTAARNIGISRRTLHRKLNRYGLEGI